MKFICGVTDSNVDDRFTYNDIVNHIEKDNADIKMILNRCTSFVPLPNIKEHFVHRTKTKKVRHIKC
jgi:hypothetical protein